MVHLCDLSPHRRPHLRHGWQPGGKADDALRQFQIEVDPDRLAAHGLNLEQVAEAVRKANRSGGGSVLEMAGAEYMVRTRGYLGALEDFGQIPLGVDDRGAPLVLRQVAEVQLGPAPRRAS